jgi:ABC-type siderophore export system fused ATPase/permease subunit
MKKCAKCGAINDNLYKNCIDCGEVLGPPVSKAELEGEEFEHSKSKRKAAYRSEYFHVSKSDKAVSMLLAIGAVLHLIYFLKHDTVNANYSFILLIVMLWMAVEAISMLKPALSWNI